MKEIYWNDLRKTKGDNMNFHGEYIRRDGVIVDIHKDPIYIIGYVGDGISPFFYDDQGNALYPNDRNYDLMEAIKLKDIY